MEETPTASNFLTNLRLCFGFAIAGGKIEAQALLPVFSETAILILKSSGFQFVEENSKFNLMRPLFGCKEVKFNRARKRGKSREKPGWLEISRKM
jgi:hypothetical protein